MKFVLSFIVYFFSFLFNNLYFKIFKVLRRYLFILPKSYATYSIIQKICYLFFVGVFSFFTFLKMYFYINIYLLFLYKILLRKYILIQKKYKNINVKNLYFIFYIL